LLPQRGLPGHHVAAHTGGRAVVAVPLSGEGREPRKVQHDLVGDPSAAHPGHGQGQVALTPGLQAIRHVVYHGAPTGGEDLLEILGQLRWRGLSQHGHVRHRIEVEAVAREVDRLFGLEDQGLGLSIGVAGHSFLKRAARTKGEACSCSCCSLLTPSCGVPGCSGDGICGAVCQEPSALSVKLLTRSKALTPPRSAIIPLTRIYSEPLDDVRCHTEYRAWSMKNGEVHVSLGDCTFSLARAITPFSKKDVPSGRRALVRPRGRAGDLALGARRACPAHRSLPS
jgi:hypothetical protein